VITLSSYYNYINAKNTLKVELEKKTEDLVKLLQSQVSITLYNFDYMGTKKTIDSFMDKKYFEKIQILHENGQLFADTSLEKIEKKQTVNLEVIQKDDKKNPCTYAKLTTQDNEKIGFIIVSKSQYLFEKMLKATQEEILKTFIITLLTTIIVALIISDKITQPILKMVDKLKNSRRDEILDLDIHTKDEFEFLSHVIELEHNLLKEKIIHDPLTNIYNRMKFNELISYEIEKYHRQEIAFCIAIMDIDFFKKVNDTYGHQAGDMVLILLTQFVVINIRKTDIFARWGGEEFVFLFHNTNIDGAYNVLEKLRKNIQEKTFGEVGKVTCSFGVTQYKKGEKLEDVFERCDKALYEAKNNGRDRVIKV